MEQGFHNDNPVIMYNLSICPDCFIHKVSTARLFGRWQRGGGGFLSIKQKQLHLVDKQKNVSISFWANSVSKKGAVQNQMTSPEGKEKLSYWCYMEERRKKISLNDKLAIISKRSKFSIVRLSWFCGESE